MILFSGPKRYRWDSDTNKWVNSRDEHCLMNLLNSEIKEITNVDLNITSQGVYDEIMHCSKE